MSQVVHPHQLQTALEKVLTRFDQNNRKAGDKVLKETMKNLFGSIIEMTPVGDFDIDHGGLLKANWILTKGAPSTETVTTPQPWLTRSSLKFNGPLQDAVFRLFGKSTSGSTYYLTNNLPYVGMVEYGGYPKDVKRGTFNKRTGKWQIRSTKGYSKQAKKGMARINLNRFRKFLNEAANKTLFKR